MQILSLQTQQQQSKEREEEFKAQQEQSKVQQEHSKAQQEKSKTEREHIKARSAGVRGVSLQPSQLCEQMITTQVDPWFKPLRALFKRCFRSPCSKEMAMFV